MQARFFQPIPTKIYGFFAGFASGIMLVHRNASFVLNKSEIDNTIAFTAATQLLLMFHMNRREAINHTALAATGFALGYLVGHNTLPALYPPTAHKP